MTSVCIVPNVRYREACMGSLGLELQSGWILGHYLRIVCSFCVFVHVLLDGSDEVGSIKLHHMFLLSWTGIGVFRFFFHCSLNQVGLPRERAF